MKPILVERRKCDVGLSPLARSRAPQGHPVYTVASTEMTYIYVYIHIYTSGAALCDICDRIGTCVTADNLVDGLLTTYMWSRASVCDLARTYFLRSRLTFKYIIITMHAGACYVNIVFPSPNTSPTPP